MDTERLRQFQELIALEPHDTVLRFGLGELYIEAGDFASAGAAEMTASASMAGKMADFIFLPHLNLKFHRSFVTSFDCRLRVEGPYPKTDARI